MNKIAKPKKERLSFRQYDLIKLLQKEGSFMCIGLNKNTVTSLVRRKIVKIFGGGQMVKLNPKFKIIPHD